MYQGTVQSLGGRVRPRYDKPGVSGPEGSSLGWVLRLAETGPDAAGESIDLIEIRRSSGLADIANLGLTLSEAKELLAGVQQAMVAAQAREHAVRRPCCASCTGQCHLKDCGGRGGSRRRSVRWRQGCGDGSVPIVDGPKPASTGRRIAARHQNWTNCTRICPLC